MVDGTDTLTDVEQAQFSDELTSLGDEGALEFTEVTDNSFIGFGANVLYRNDDGYQAGVDISSIFENGITIAGVPYNDLAVNTNGNITAGIAPIPPARKNAQKVKINQNPTKINIEKIVAFKHRPCSRSSNDL